MSTLILRPRQEAVLDKVRAAWNDGATNVLIQAPCGFGKSECAVAMLKAVYEKRKRGLFVCDRIALVQQSADRFAKYDLPHGIIMASHPLWRPWERVQVCSVQTIRRRQWPEADLLVGDEVHVMSKTLAEKLMAREVRAIGLTATPFTPGLGKLFDVAVNAATTQELIDEGWLTPFEAFEPSTPDMSGVPVSKGEWEEAETEKRVLPIVGDCVAEYLAHGQGRKFIGFAVTVVHAEELCRQFLSAGVVAHPYTYRTPDAERSAMLDEFRKPDSRIRGLVSIESLTRGFDVADIGVLILARPLRNSLTVHLQMLGRAIRTAPGKSKALVLDHAGNMRRFWDPMWDFLKNGITELDDGSVKKPKKAHDAKAPTARKCVKCHHVFSRRPACPKCGHVLPKKAVQHEAGRLVQVEAALDPGAMQRFYSELVWLARERGYKDGWAAWSFKDRFGRWPNGYVPAPALPSVETLRWVRSRQIRRAKGRAKAGLR